MLFSIIKAPFARSLLAGSASRLARPTSVRLLEARRTFLTTVVLAETAKAAKKPKDTTTKTAKSTAVKAVKTVKTAAKAKPAKEPKILKKHLKIPHRRPASAWQDFLQQYLTKHKKEGEKLPLELAPAASEAYQALSAEEKAKYGASKEETKEYLRLSKEYRTTSPEYKKARKVHFKHKNTPDHLNVYSAFIKLNFKKDSPLSFGEQAKELAEHWKTLTLAEKETYRVRGLELLTKRGQAKKEKVAAAE